MKKVNRELLENVLFKLGISAGDGVMVHSALQFLGIPEGGVRLYYETLYDVLQIGSGTGTLVVPTFNFGFCRGIDYDQEKTPAEEMGVFPEFVRKQPGVLRSPHPMQSICAVGLFSKDLCDRDTQTVFENGSVFERMLDLDFKLLLLGADVKYTTMVHLPEQRMQVPYRYWKSFSGTVRLTGEEAKYCTYRTFVRDLEKDPDVNAGFVKERLIQKGLWKSSKLNYGDVATCQFKDFVKAEEEILLNDPFGLLNNKNSFSKSNIII